MLHAALTVRLPSASPMPIPHLRSPPAAGGRERSRYGHSFGRVRSTDGAAFGVSADLLSATQTNTLSVQTGRQVSGEFSLTPANE